MSDDGVMAHGEEGRIITAPIAGVIIQYWFDCQASIVEAK